MTIDLADPTALAASIDPPTRAVIGGRSVEADSGKTFAPLNPANGRELAQVAEGDAADVDRAVAAARTAFEEGPWGRLAPIDRKMLILRFASLVEAHTDELAVIETLEAGKPISDCSSLDVPDLVATLRWHAEAADKLYAQLSPSGPGKVGMVVREPIGVVGAVLPWNYPLMMAGWKIGPILAAGNTCVVKPAEQTSMSTIRIAELAIEAGIPDGVFNVVPGFGETAGAAIGLHPDVDCVAFTGSTEVGRHFLRYSADSNLKEVLLECGGKSPVIVMADADDLDAAATGICEGIFWNRGQNCSANSRLIVQRSVEDELLERIAERSRDWVVGDPLVAETTMGAMIEEAHLDKVLSHIADAHEAGSTCAVGGNRVREESGGWFVEPTVFTDVDPNSRLAREEVFGPVLAVTAFDTPEEAIRLATATDYGLAGTIHTTDLRTAHLAARAIRAGTVAVNCYGEGDITTPFGGFKQSGIGGRDKSIAAHEQYTELKTIWMDLS